MHLTELSTLFFKESDQKRQYLSKSLDPRMRYLLTYVSQLLMDRFDFDTTVTSVLRKDNESSPHFYGRAVDIRSHGLTMRESMFACELINDAFIYDINRPSLKTALFHDVGQGSTYTYR